MNAFKVLFLIAILELVLAVPQRNVSQKKLSLLSPRNFFKHSKSSQVKLFKSDCNCHLAIKSRIINGEKSPAHSIPWQAALFDGDSFFCGAIIVNKRHVMTSAHCALDLNKNTTRVHVGLVRLDNNRDCRKIHSISDAFLLNENISEDMEGFIKKDLAILKLAEPIKYIKGEVEPACLNMNLIRTYGKLMASGWGAEHKIVSKIVNGTEEFNIFQNPGDKGEAAVTTMELRHALLDEDWHRCKPGFICTKETGGKSICLGDFGGPLHYTRNGYTTVEGVASNTRKDPRLTDVTHVVCPTDGIFTKLSDHRAWFEKIVGEDYCSSVIHHF